MQKLSKEQMEALDEYAQLLTEMIKYKKSIGIDTFNDSKELGKIKKYKENPKVKK